jgi:RNA polymerase sigma-70 factor (ECF subfamily)
MDLSRVLAEEDEQTLAIAYLRFVDELTLEEVAEIVGLSRKTVQKRIDALRARSLRRAAGGTA